jgi:hypothetical protein
MTRIGRCQIKGRSLAGNAFLRRENLAPLKIFQTKRPSTLTLPDPQAFLKWHSGVGYMPVKQYTAQCPTRFRECLRAEPQIGRVSSLAEILGLLELEGVKASRSAIAERKATSL